MAETRHAVGPMGTGRGCAPGARGICGLGEELIGLAVSEGTFDADRLIEGAGRYAEAVVPAAEGAEEVRGLLVSMLASELAHGVEGARDALALIR